MRRKAFTLVELLVVIAIIALLISILAPSLKMAKDITKQMNCSTNLHAIGVATIMYTEANRGQMPPWMEPAGTGGADYIMSYSFTGIPGGLTFTYCAPSNVPDIESASGKVRPRGILSVLLYFGQLEKSDSLFCPSIMRWQLSRAAYPEPYGTKLNPNDSGNVANGIIKCSYPFNPNVTSAGRQMEFTYKKIDKVPSDKIIATDPLYTIPLDWGGTWHVVSGETSPTWVLLYADAHATTKVSASAYKYLYDTGSNAWDDCPIFLKALSYIQD
jgi:prepilin-type N-terminal cleavage/methylation domain-containing protein